MVGQREADNRSITKKIPHVLLLPVPLQGPISCFLKLAELLSLSSSSHAGKPTSTSIHVTFINALFAHRRLSHLTSGGFRRNPNFQFSAVSDGIAGDEPRPPSKFASMVATVEDEVIRLLPEFAVKSPPVTCLIADGIFMAAGEEAMKLGIPVLYLSTLSPCCIWVNSSLVPTLVDNGDVPFKQGIIGSLIFEFE
uniref:Uncharacterized protein n=1 Tax=Opuntia streptacantha TaxID=393608 RepID=A0A7C8Z500_OPUST